MLKPLNNVLQKSWKKIGIFKLHTLNRLQKYGLLKLEDELAIQESKIIWKWDKKIIPKSLSLIIKEKNDILRGRRFELIRNSKIGSIHQRLTKRANLHLQDISTATSKKCLAKKMKTQFTTVKYNFNCSKRNCFICN